MADDMGIGDTTVYNPRSRIPTPNMEKLAKQGVVFTDAHSPSSMCTPTRYALLTGRYCWRTWLWRGVYGGYNRPLIKKERMTIASLLKQNGYSTACVGKWHLGMDWAQKEKRLVPEDDAYDQFNIDFTKAIKEGPLQRGFDYFFGTSGCTTDDPPMCFIENDHTVGIPNVIAAKDPADHCGILSWHSQVRDYSKPAKDNDDLSFRDLKGGQLQEAGSYGYLLEARISPDALRKAQAEGVICIRLEVDDSLPGGLAIYGERFGRYPLDPTLAFVLKN